jgi:hypothetical protein
MNKLQQREGNSSRDGIVNVRFSQGTAAVGLKIQIQAMPFIIYN